MDQECGLLFSTRKNMGVPEFRPATDAPARRRVGDNCESAAVDVNLLGIDDDSNDDEPPLYEPVEHPLQAPPFEPVGRATPAEPAELHPLRPPAEPAEAAATEKRTSRFHGVTHHLWSKPPAMNKNVLVSALSVSVWSSTQQVRIFCNT